MTAKRILLIEDEAGARDALESLLAEEGFEVASAGTGARGLAELYDFRPDTVVCDFLLPDTDGLQVLRHVRRAAGHGVTFIVLTAGCGGEEAERALEREADFFFRKPIDLPRLRRALEHEAREWEPATRV
jgi:two-component system, OmpR family, response regulator